MPLLKHPQIQRTGATSSRPSKWKSDASDGGREQEQTFLMRAFGHGSRHKLTRYADLVAYLRQLKLIQANDDASNAPVPIRRGDLLSQGDLMLEATGLELDQARAFLQQHLGSTSRQQLSDEQLLQFNMLLEEQTLSGTK